MQRRYSRQREMVLNFVKESHTHPTAEEVYQKLKQVCPTLSRGTVYRNLKLLVQEGALERIACSVERYDGDTNPHAHFRCEQCGRVHDLEIPYEVEMDQQAAQQMGVTIRKHDLIFCGICSTCASMTKIQA